MDFGLRSNVWRPIQNHRATSPSSFASTTSSLRTLFYEHYFSRPPERYPCAINRLGKMEEGIRLLSIQFVPFHHTWTLLPSIHISCTSIWYKILVATSTVLSDTQPTIQRVQLSSYVNADPITSLTYCLYGQTFVSTKCPTRSFSVACWWW